MSSLPLKGSGISFTKSRYELLYRPRFSTRQSDGDTYSRLLTIYSRLTLVSTVQRHRKLFSPLSILRYRSVQHPYTTPVAGGLKPEAPTWPSAVGGPPAICLPCWPSSLRLRLPAASDFLHNAVRAP